MRYQHVCVEAFSYTLPPHVVTSAEVEQRLKPVYDRLGLPAGRLELMTGIRERRFFERGTRPSTISAITAAKAIEAAGIDRRHFGALIHGSVSRDQLEPATASSVHHALGLPQSALVLDVTNACLGILNGMTLVASMIELGQIRAGVVVGTEDGRDLVEATIDALLNSSDITRKDVKLEFASLTIGSGSAAVVLCHRELSHTGHRLLGGAMRADTASHHLCAGGDLAAGRTDERPRMQTDSEALLNAGVQLATQTWDELRQTLNWDAGDVDRVFTHQVGRAHRKLLLDELKIDPSRDFSTFDFLGNTGAAALPTAVAIGVERGFIRAGDQVALLGIGSGINSLMLGIDWQAT